MKKIRTKLIQEENILSQPWHWKAIKDFFLFFWSYMKSQEQNQCKKKMLYHSLSIKKPLKISSSFQFFLKLHEKSRTKSMQDFFQLVVFLKLHEKFRTKWMQKENVLSQPWHWKAMKDLFQFPAIVSNFYLRIIMFYLPNVVWKAR